MLAQLWTIRTCSGVSGKGGYRLDGSFGFSYEAHHGELVVMFPSEVYMKIRQVFEPVYRHWLTPVREKFLGSVTRSDSWISRDPERRMAGHLAGVATRLRSDTHPGSSQVKIPFRIELRPKCTNLGRNSLRIVAVDWSGAAKRSEEKIWAATVESGKLTRLENGRSREEIVDYLLGLADGPGPTLIGLDFAFSYPRWWCDKKGWTNAREVWSAISEEGHAILANPSAPFYGRGGVKANFEDSDEPKRETDRDHSDLGSQSPFLLAGAGHVGTATIMGMPILSRLSAEGFSVWPFAPKSDRTIVEIFPRAFAPGVNKLKWSERLDFLRQMRIRDPEGERNLSETMVERAAGSDDAFDAAVSALAMSKIATEGNPFEQPSDPAYQIEGMIWPPK